MQKKYIRSLLLHPRFQKKKKRKKGSKSVCVHKVIHISKCNTKVFQVLIPNCQCISGVNQQLHSFNALPIDITQDFT